MADADVAARRRGQAPLIRPDQPGYGGPASGQAGASGFGNAGFGGAGFGSARQQPAGLPVRRRQAAPDWQNQPGWSAQLAQATRPSPDGQPDQRGLFPLLPDSGAAVSGPSDNAGGANRRERWPSGTGSDVTGLVSAGGAARAAIRTRPSQARSVAARPQAGNDAKPAPRPSPRADTAAPAANQPLRTRPAAQSPRAQSPRAQPPGAQPPRAQPPRAQPPRAQPPRAQPAGPLPKRAPADSAQANTAQANTARAAVAEVVAAASASAAATARAARAAAAKAATEPVPWYERARTNRVSAGRRHCGHLERILHREWAVGDEPPPQVVQAVDRLAELPQLIKERLVAGLDAIYIGPGGVPDLDDMGALAGMPLPSGRATWDVCAGAYGERKVVVGSRPSPTPDVMCHEIGHALDDLDGAAGSWLSDCDEFMGLYDKCLPSMVSDFHRQPGQLGRREFFADAFAAIASSQRPALVEMVGGNTRAALSVMLYFNVRYGI